MHKTVITDVSGLAKLKRSFRFVLVCNSTLKYALMETVREMQVSKTGPINQF